MTLCRALGFSALLCAGVAQAQTPEALDTLLKSDIEKWWPIIKAAGIKGE